MLAAVAAGVVLAAPAQAAPEGPDANFIAALDKAGISYHSPEQAIAAGKEVCSMMTDGESAPAVVQKMTQFNPGFTSTGAEKFAAIAATAYCPQYVSGGGQPPAPPAPPGAG